MFEISNMAILLSEECDLKKTGGRLDRPPASALRGSLGRFLAALGVGLLLVHDPGVGQVEQLGHRQQVVETEAVGLLPGFSLPVAASGNDAVPVALVAVVSPDRDLQSAATDFVCWM